VNVFGGRWNVRGMVGPLFPCGTVHGMGVDFMVDPDKGVALLWDLDLRYLDKAANDPMPARGAPSA
jgi:hypothetical protein